MANQLHEYPDEGVVENTENEPNAEPMNELKAFIKEYKLESIENKLISEGITIKFLLSIDDTTIDSIKQQLSPNNVIQQHKFKFAVQQLQKRLKKKQNPPPNQQPFINNNNPFQSQQSQREQLQALLLTNPQLLNTLMQQFQQLQLQQNNEIKQDTPNNIDIDEKYEGIKRINFNIKTTSDQKFKVCVPENCSIMHLKNYIQTASPNKVHPSLQRLIFAGKVLKDAKCIKDYNMKNEHTIILVKSRRKRVNPSNRYSNISQMQNAIMQPMNQLNTGYQRNQYPQINQQQVNNMLQSQSQAYNNNNNNVINPYQNQLTQLNAMGFTDINANLRALKATNGNVQAAADWLLNH